MLGLRPICGDKGICTADIVRPALVALTVDYFAAWKSAAQQAEWRSGARAPWRSGTQAEWATSERNVLWHSSGVEVTYSGDQGA